MIAKPVISPDFTIEDIHKFSLEAIALGNRFQKDTVIFIKPRQRTFRLDAAKDNPKPAEAVDSGIIVLALEKHIF